MDEDERTEEREDVAEDREEVAEETTPETDEQATEQRTDDYDGLARRLDDLTEMIRGLAEDVRRGFDALGLAAESAGYVDDSIDPAEIAEDIADAIDELVGLEALDLL